MARIILNAKQIPEKLLAESIHTACYMLKLCALVKRFFKTGYEIWKGRKPNLS